MITNQKAAGLAQALASEEFKNIKFTLAGNRKVQFNVKSLTDFMEQVKATEKRHTDPTPGILALENEKKELLKPFVELDAAGEIKLRKNNGIILKNDKDEPAVIELLNQLNKAHEPAIKEYNESMQEWATFFTTEEAEVSLKMVEETEVKLSDDLVMGQELFSLLSLMIPSLVEVEEEKLKLPDNDQSVNKSPTKE